VARLPNTLCLIAPGWKGETQVMAMDLAGYAVSAGSACSSGKVKASRTLRAMGFDEAAAGQAIRLSIGPGVTRDEVLRFAEAWGPGAALDVTRGADQGPHEAGLLTLDCAKARALLGWRPRLDLDTALIWCAGWYRAWAEGLSGGGQDLRDLCNARIDDFFGDFFGE
jgi:hypothetical protein